MNTLMPSQTAPSAQLGKIRANDKRTARLLNYLPWISVILTSVPLPLVFLFLFLTSTATDSAAVYLLLSFVSFGLGLVVGLLLATLLFFYRQRWRKNLRNRLAADGVTANEVHWFETELSSEERKTWRSLKAGNPLLADAYCETLAARLTATRIGARARDELLRIERQIHRTRSLQGIDNAELLAELAADRERVGQVREEAASRLTLAKARLQTIEASANRALNQTETELMLQRLTSTLEHSPLALEMSKLEQETLRELNQR